jgi:hypothetical protein
MKNNPGSNNELLNIALAIPVIVVMMLAIRYIAGWILLAIIFVPFLFIGNHLSLGEYDRQAKEHEARQDAKRKLEMELEKEAFEEPPFRKTVENIKFKSKTFTLATLDDYIKEIENEQHKL